MDGTRLQGVLKSLDMQRGGLLRCLHFPEDLPFTLADLPPELRRRADEGGPAAALAPDAELLFTLSLGADGARPPRAREVMPMPGADDLIFGDVFSYNVNSGYGFIKPAEDSVFVHDVYFNTKDILDVPEEELRKNLIGVACGFNVRVTHDGRPQAKRIELITKPEGPAPGDEAAEPTGQVLQGIVKTFKPSSGYGFINCGALGRDVWFPRREVPTDWLRKDLRGTEVSFELWVTEDEKPQARSLKELPNSAGRAQQKLPAAFAGKSGPHRPLQGLGATLGQGLGLGARADDDDELAAAIGAAAAEAEAQAAVAAAKAEAAIAAAVAWRRQPEREAQAWSDELLRAPSANSSESAKAAVEKSEDWREAWPEVATSTRRRSRSRDTERQEWEASWPEMAPLVKRRRPEDAAAPAAEKAAGEKPSASGAASLQS